jgi:hypothetical protein
MPIKPAAPESVPPITKPSAVTPFWTNRSRKN